MPRKVLNQRPSWHCLTKESSLSFQIFIRDFSPLPVRNIQHLGRSNPPSLEHISPTGPRECAKNTKFTVLKTLIVLNNSKYPKYARRRSFAAALE